MFVASRAPMDRACKLGGNAISLRLERCWSKHSWSGFYDTHVVLTNAAALLGSTNRRRRQVRLACSFISNKCATFLVGRFASPRCRKGSSTLYVRKPVKIFFFICASLKMRSISTSQEFGRGVKHTLHSELAGGGL